MKLYESNLEGGDFIRPRQSSDFPFFLRRARSKFRLLRKSDLEPGDYKRVAEADGKEVPWEEIVKRLRISRKGSS